MAEPARRTASELPEFEDLSARPSSAAQAANVNANPRRGQLGPAPSRDPLRMASELGAAQTRDRATATREDPFPVPEEERVFLEPETRSYAQPEETDAERERRRQEQMLRTSRKFLIPAEEERPTPPERRPAAAPPEEPEEEEAEGEAQVHRAQLRAQGELQRGKAQERFVIGKKKEAAERIHQEAQRQYRALVKANKLYRRIIDGIGVAGSETIVPLVMVICKINVEMVNKWIFKFSVPPIYLVDKRPKFDAMDVVTCFVDFLLIVVVMLVFIQLFIQVAIIIIVWGEIIEGVSKLFNIFSGIFE